MKKEIEIFLNIVKQALNLKDLKSSDIDKLNLIVASLEINKNTKIEKIGHGTYSNVYKIGNKVLKIGLAKMDERIIDHPRIIKIYLKTNILIETNNMPMKIGVEIQKFAKASFPSESELYSLYKALRKDGIIWHDIKASNTGYVDNQLVVIDTDYIYFVNEPSIYFDNIDIKFDEMYNNDEEK